jgi:hypothetical protein
MDDAEIYAVGESYDDVDQEMQADFGMLRFLIFFHKINCSSV